MDQHTGTLPTSSSYQPLPSIAPQQLQYNASHSSHTLPPLQGQHGGLPMHSMYGQSLSAPHTPTTAAPNTSISTGNGGYQQMSGQSALRGYHLQGASYQQPLQSYNTASSLMPPSSAAMSLPQAATPSSAPSNNRLVPIRPMTSAPPLHPQHGLLPLQPAMSAGYGLQNMIPDSDIPTHVVGSQGRRGVLPSAPGRPPVGVTGTGSTKSATMPAKDADGKFPCPHCNKTYLHAKHLKRHLLRHTGDRPYMCVLCRDTFSRSDILKRHFQKCSIRRGNPTGASHLSAQAHLKKSSSRSAVEDLLRNMNGVNTLPTDSNVAHPFGVGSDTPDRRALDGSSNLTDDQVKQEQSSQSNSLKRLSSSGGRNRRSLTGPGPGGSVRASFDQSEIPTTMASNMNTQLPTFSMSNGHNGATFAQNFDFAPRSNGAALQPQEDMSLMANGRGAMPMFGGAGGAQQSGVDWSQMFQPGAQDGFMGPFNTNLDHNQIVINSEPSLTLSNDGLFTGLYPTTGGVDKSDASENTFPGWNMPYSHPDPFQQIASTIIKFCSPPNFQHLIPNHEMRDYLSATNIKHFLEQFTNFQGHFPIIHMSTFRITEAYSGLLLAMICVGAVYSNRITASQVRDLMELAKLVIERDSRIFSVVNRASTGIDSLIDETLGRHKAEIEEIQAIFLLHVLFTWHGKPVQREVARRNFPMLIKIVERAGLARPSNSPGLFSVLHQPNVVVKNVDSANFNWNAWAEQEKRSRLFYMAYLCDAAMALYFNIRPHFDSYDICLPLPADDAAWDARNASQCADALGLCGQVAAKDSNFEGSGYAKQPEFNTALQALMDTNVSLITGTTNLYSKFILIHALHVQIWLTQRQQSVDADSANTYGLTRSGATTPSSQSDWGYRSADGSINGRVTANSSRRATPVDLEGQINGTLLAINKSLDKWKMAWDDDMATQYPPSSTSYKRFGFCRDGVHFYYLAKYLIAHKLDWHVAPDKRLTYVMQLLRSAKIYVVPDSAKRGEGLGSVNDIDQNYGISDLTLDMAHLFKPINEELNSPIPGIHTNIGGGIM